MEEGFFDDAAQENDEEEAEEVQEAEEGAEPAEDGEADQADAEEGEPGSDVDSSEEDEGPDEYEKDNFLVEEDEEEEEGGQGQSEKKRRRKRRREREEQQLDEEDYALLEDAGHRVQRPTALQHKRIRKKGHEAAPASTPHQLQQELFGPEGDDYLDEEVPEDRPTGARQQQRYEEPEAEYDEDEEDDEMAGFIDDDTGDPGQPRRQRRRRPSGAPAGVSISALNDARDIFGDNIDELLEDYQQRQLAGEEDYADMEALPEDLEDDLAADDLRAEQEEKRQQRRMRRVARAVEPEVLARHMLLPEDDVIRAQDIPERLQAAAKFGPTVFDVDACAQFVLDHLLGHKQGRCRREAELLAQGIIEIDGPLTLGQEEDLEPNGTADLQLGRRGLRQRRERRAAAAWPEDEHNQQALKTAIRAALVEMFEKNSEVPYIASFCKEILGELLVLQPEDRPEVTSFSDHLERKDKQLPDISEGVVQARHRTMRRWDVLWAVQSLGLRYRALAKRRELRQKAYEAAVERFMSDEQSEDYSALQDCISGLQEATTTEALDDLDLKVKLITEGTLAADMAVLAVNDLPRLKRATQKSVYTIGKQAGIDVMVKALNCSPAELGENLTYTYRRYDFSDEQTTPAEFAERLVDRQQPAKENAAAVMGACREMAAHELAAEPTIRGWVRQQLPEKTTISTDPTPAGDTKLDPFHPLGRAKVLREKPVESLAQSDLYLRIHQAEAEGLITVRLQVDDREILRMLEAQYCSTGVSDASRAWNAFRRDILKEMYEAKLLPGLKAELKAKLLTDAREHVATQCGNELWKLLQPGPYKIRYQDSDDFVESRRFVGVCWGPGQPATTLTLVDETGALIDILHAGSFSGAARRPYNRDMPYRILEDPLRKKDAERILDFLIKHTPHAVLVGTTNIHSKALFEDLCAIRDHILENQPQVLTRSDTGDMAVRYASEAVPDVWASSAFAKEEFSDQLDIARKAIAVARMALEPLAVISSVCHPAQKDALALPLHPLQKSLLPDDLLAILHRTLITAVNQVGVDVNGFVGTPWKGSALPFVSGLGTRKAAAVQRAVQQRKGVDSRKDLWTPGITGRNVFRNCAGFLRVRAGDETGTELDPLDDMRIHPLAYQLAGSVARAALGVSTDAVDEDDQEQNLIERALKEKAKIEGVNLALLNERHMESTEGAGTSKQSTLIDIAMEYVLPYADLRRDPRMLKAEEEFWALTGESADTLKEGRLVEARVVFVTADRVKCQLPEFGGLEAELDAADISSRVHGFVDARQCLERGAVVTARIKAVMPLDWRVSLTTRSGDLNDDRTWEDKYCADPEFGGDDSYHVRTPEELRAEARKLLQSQLQGQKRDTMPNRPIRHPNFKNVSMAVAADQIRGAEIGEIIIRPSAKATDRICLTMKVHEGTQGPVLIHQDVQETKKPGAIGAHLKLGTPLTVCTFANQEGDAFDDLDELIARYAEPYIASFKTLTKHRKFRDGDKVQVLEGLKRERARSPGVPVYCLGLKTETPGNGYICFIRPTPTATPHYEYFAVSAHGVWFRHRNCDIEQMLGEFKRNPAADEAKRPDAPSRLGYDPPQLAPAQPSANGYTPVPMQTGYAPPAVPPAYATPYGQPYPTQHYPAHLLGSASEVPTPAPPRPPPNYGHPPGGGYAPMHSGAGPGPGSAARSSAVQPPLPSPSMWGQRPQQGSGAPPPLPSPAPGSWGPRNSSSQAPTPTRAPLPPPLPSAAAGYGQYEGPAAGGSALQPPLPSPGMWGQRPQQGAQAASLHGPPGSGAPREWRPRMPVR